MVLGDARRFLRIGIFAYNCQRLTNAVRTSSLDSLHYQPISYAASDRLRKRDPQATRPVFEQPVLFLGKLYLRTHHDVMIVPP